MALRVTEWMTKRGLTAYRLSKDSDGRIPMRTAYRLESGEKQSLTSDEVAALCEVLQVKPAELFDRQ